MKHHKKDIIEVGQDLFRTNGYHATGVSLILEKCSISKGTFYNYFSSKEEFALQTIQNYSLQIQKLITTYTNFESISPSKRIKRFFEQLIKINRSEGSTKGCLIMNFMVELSGNDDSIANAVNKEFNLWVSMLLPTIEQAQENKEMTTALTAREIAEFLYLQVYGNFAQMKALRSTIKMQTNFKIAFDLICAK